MTPFNIIDISYTCWNDTSPPMEEIIEIAVLSVNLDNEEELSLFSSLVLPQHSNNVSCQEQTGITEEMLIEEGQQFPLVLRTLQATHEIYERPWGYWSEDVHQVLVAECERQNVMDAISKESHNLHDLNVAEKGRRPIANVSCIADALFSSEFELS